MAAARQSSCAFVFILVGDPFENINFLQLPRFMPTNQFRPKVCE
ncbi:hypothetical protein C4J92_2851 [Pseudomonas sp. R3-18-08]|nr:hypothetical protein C4J92_2851 [Pseudomonas sp. R3-18-08]